MTKLTLLVPMVTEDVTKPCPPSFRGYSSLASTSASGVLILRPEDNLKMDSMTNHLGAKTPDGGLTAGI